MTSNTENANQSQAVTAGSPGAAPSAEWSGYAANANWITSLPANAVALGLWLLMDHMLPDGSLKTVFYLLMIGYLVVAILLMLRRLREVLR